MATKTSKIPAPVTVKINDDLSADVIVGHCIRIYGTRKSGLEATGNRRVYVMGGGAYPASQPVLGAAEWLATLSQSQTNELAAVLGCSSAENGIAGDWIEEHGGNRLWEPILNHHQIHEPVVVEVDLTYNIGDTAEHSSYNTHFFGVITSITAKTVTIRGGTAFQPSTHRLKLEKFVTHNWDGLEQKRRTNAEFMD